LDILNLLQEVLKMESKKYNRRSRAKRHIAWEQTVLQSNGLYSHNLETIAGKFPALTPMELRVAALVKAMMPSWEIAEKLSIREETVEQYRWHIRRKLGISNGGGGATPNVPSGNLAAVLAAI
jgi:DNA-binding NarL/FixJ family response regulator